jgi:hypothetical protein
VEAQLSHADPNQVRAAYNHADFVEQHHRIMQYWADRLDLFERDKVERASRPLVVHLEGATTPAVWGDGRLRPVTGGKSVPSNNWSTLFVAKQALRTRCAYTRY